MKKNIKRKIDEKEKAGENNEIITNKKESDIKEIINKQKVGKKEDNKKLNINDKKRGLTK